MPRNVYDCINTTKNWMQQWRIYFFIISLNCLLESWCCWKVWTLNKQNKKKTNYFQRECWACVPAMVCGLIWRSDLSLHCPHQPQQAREGSTSLPGLPGPALEPTLKSPTRPQLKEVFHCEVISKPTQCTDTFHFKGRKKAKLQITTTNVLQNFMQIIITIYLIIRHND